MDIHAAANGLVVALSTASVYPESSASAFDLAARLGYDAIELMVGIDESSSDLAAVRHLRDYYELPVVAVHAPCLLITQRVWGTDPWGKLQRSAEMAAGLDAGLVVVHPPFRWQRDYARTFADGVERLRDETGVRFAVENMFPWRTARRELQAYAPDWDPLGRGYSDVTLDLSHTATAGSDAMAMARELGSRLAHVHLADGIGTPKDEHLVPGRGSQPCAELLTYLPSGGYSGAVVVEINTRRCPTRSARESDLAEALAFTREHLAVAAP